MILSAIRKYNFIGRFYSSRIGKNWIYNKLKTVCPHINNEELLVDIGCGNGMITHALRQQKFNCTPLDVKDLSIVEQINPIIYNGENMPFSDNEFDTALLLTVLHHTTDPKVVLLETARIAKKIIIIEDIYTNKLQQYLTYTMDTIINLGFSKMTYQNKSDLEWKKTFNDLGLELIAESSKSILLFFRQSTYVLKAK
ncbi:MAG: class I SAM-dependent methyltransferase [Saprospiraceae bacterium]|nr:class I SAM-dependent methyltransferase [Saprospiraceae bacterium]